jgi:two-component system, cell cycle sensor histidine kinase and response regulator CckA
MAALWVGIARSLAVVGRALVAEGDELGFDLGVRRAASGRWRDVRMRRATGVTSWALQDTTGSMSWISMGRRASEALRTCKTQYGALFEQSRFSNFLYHPETLRFLAVNDAAVRHYGYSRDEFLKMDLDALRPPGDVVVTRSSMSASDLGTTERRHATKDGSVIDVEITVHDFMPGSSACYLAVALDVTERNRTEEQLRQAQKMAAIGVRAGGVAHDLNNLLSVILSYSETLAATFESGNPMRDDLEAILGAGQRAAELTRQLQKSTGPDALRPAMLDINAVIGGVARMLERVLGGSVKLAVVSGSGLGTVSADPGEVERVLMNLVVNARDAMPAGGEVTIETAAVELDSGYASTHSGVKPGTYVMLAVTDTGSGMDATTCARIFEPFFTTKEKGKGTGLGLSTVFGIVEQGGGSIAVDSEPGAGTTMKVYLPQASPACAEAAEPFPFAWPPRSVQIGRVRPNLHATRG